ncbi:MAG: aminoglycoside phosphotransferase family protein [Ignavibacteriae bacterium]|nr:aminoglycoside phosphotransferase family protein [Ignavibacteriota bacterium]MCB9214572.1 aminoglycoside phosphotransferase family protein [Ignavibacteria bacterium]
MSTQIRSDSLATPPAEVEISHELVQSLLSRQHPDLANLPLQIVDQGWDNVMFRLGNDFSIRLPRRTIAATLIEHEQRWLPLIADQLPLSVPVPLRVGEPDEYYPWRWSILPWLQGETADRSEPDALAAEPFANFLRALHLPAPSDAPRNPTRGAPLKERAAVDEKRMDRLSEKTHLITSDVRKIWNDALRAEIDIPLTWIHGDLHSRNILVEGGAITGILDWGDLALGDPATDLVAVWMLFSDSQVRQDVLKNYNPKISEQTVARAKGWAISFGAVLLETGMNDHPAHAIIGERVLERVVEEVPS